VVLEVDLDHLVGESKHYSMSRSHPLLDIDHILHFSLFVGILSVLFKKIFGLVVTLEIAPKVLEKSDFLLQFFWVFGECILFSEVLTITRSSFHIVNMMTIGVQYYFGRVVEEHTSYFVGQVVAETVLSGIIDPLLNPNLSLSGLNDLAAIILSLRSFGNKSVSSSADLIIFSASNHGCSRRSYSLSGCKIIHTVFLFTSWAELVDVGLRRRTS